MAGNRIDAFVEYVVTGLLRDNKKKPFLLIPRSALSQILGGQRLGSAQKYELRDACRRADIGLAEHQDRLLFFEWEDVKGLTIDAARKTHDLKKVTDHFERLRDYAADAEWEEYKFPQIA
jgi:hypothetical protein